MVSLGTLCSVRNYFISGFVGNVTEENAATKHSAAASLSQTVFAPNAGTVCIPPLTKKDLYMTIKSFYGLFA